MVEVSNKFGNGLKFTFLIILLLVSFGSKLPAVKIFGDGLFALIMQVIVIPAIIGFGFSYWLVPNDNDSVNKTINKVGTAIVIILIVLRFLSNYN